jgi:protein transport protein SEC13
MGAAASSDGRVSVFTHEEDDSWTVEYLKDTPLGVNAVSWAPYGVRKSATQPKEGEGGGSGVQPMPPRLVTGGSDNGIRIWCKNIDTGIWEQDDFVSSGDVRHKDWKQGGDDGVDGEEEEINKVWTPTVLHTFDDPVWRVSWSITGNILAVSSGDSNVSLWKEGLDGSWTQVSQVEDVASPKGADEGALGMGQ